VRVVLVTAHVIIGQAGIAETARGPMTRNTEEQADITRTAQRPTEKQISGLRAQDAKNPKSCWPFVGCFCFFCILDTQIIPGAARVFG
jgi:hypothetical protein